MASAKTLIDGDYLKPTPVGPRRFVYPFRMNGDRVSNYFEEDCWQTEATYVPQELGITHDTMRDYILIGESDPRSVLGGICSFTRTWARIPSTQSVPGTIMVNRPSVSATLPAVVGSYFVMQPDSTQALYDAYLRRTVTSDSGTPSSDGYPTGGTYTLSFQGATTAAIAYNANAATVQSALNALTPISDRGGVVVSGTYNSAGGFTIQFNGYAQITINTGSLVGTLNVVQTNTNSGYSQVVSVKRLAADISATTGSLTKSGAAAASIIVNSGSGSTATSRDYWFQTNGGVWNGGTYTLTVHGLTTGAIAYNASYSAVASALNALGIGTFSVSAYPTSPSDTQPLSNGDTIIRALITWVSVTPTGTFTLTAFGQTTGSLAYNASASTVQTALNALSNVTLRGGCSVSGNLTDGYSITFSNTLTDPLTGTATSLVPTGSTITVTDTSSGIGWSQKVTFTAGPSVVRAVYSAAHGFALTDRLYLKAGSSYYYVAPGGFTLPDGDTVLLNTSAGSVFYVTGGTITEIGKRTKANYAPGAVAVPCTFTTRFSVNTITPDTYQGDDASVLQACFGSTAFNLRVGDATRWPSGSSPIYSITTTSVNASSL